MLKYLINETTSKAAFSSHSHNALKGTTITETETESKQAKINQTRYNNALTWDKETALKRMRGKQERLRILIDKFLNDMPERIEKIEASNVSHDLEEIAHISHIVKGVAGNLGAFKLMQLADEIEQAARSESEDLDEFIIPLAPAFLEVSKVLREYRLQ